MEILETTFGSMGKGGGGGQAPVEKPDTLHSKQTIRLLLALSEGEITSIDDILLNGASVSNYSEGVVWDWRAGTANQTAIPGFSEIEAPMSGGGSFPLQLLKDVQHIYSFSGGVDAVRVTLTTPTLKFIDDTGNRVGYKVRHELYTRPHILNQAPGTWSLIHDNTKKGKTTKPYAWDLRLSKPGTVTVTDSWDIMVVRKTINDNSDQRYSTTYIQQIITIVESHRTYPKTALLGLTIKDAQLFGGSVPEIRIRVKGIKVFLPTNYNATTHVYSEGTPWNGSFKSFREYTNNLSWCIYDILTNPDAGLPIAASDVDVGSFYTFAKYCDTMISDGRGGSIYRYTVDNQFIDRENISTFLMHLLTLGNANFSTNEFGQLKIIWDGPNQSISKLVSNANVIDGLFNYSSNDIESRVSLVNVTYASELLQGDTDTATEWDNDLLVRYGVQPSDIVFIGCTSEARAKHKARWALYTNSVNPELVSFSMLFYGASFRVGDLVSIMDSDNADANPLHAVIKSSSTVLGTTTIQLDRPMVFSDEEHTATFILTDGTSITTRNISESNGTFSAITILASVAPFIGSTILFSKLSLVPRLAKVLSIEKEDERYNITCATHTEEKYAYIDDIGQISDFNPTSNFVNFSQFSVPAPVNLSFEEIFSSTEVNTYAKLAIDWDWDLTHTQKFKPKFKIAWAKDDDNTVLITNLSTSNYEIESPKAGVYEVTVWATNPFSGLDSPPLTGVYSFRTTAGLSSLEPPINVRVTGTAGFTFNTPDCSVSWDYNPANSAVGIPDTLKDYYVEVWDTAETALQATFTVPQAPGRGGIFNFSFARNVATFGTPTRSFKLKIFSRDTMGDKSGSVSATISNPSPAIPTWNVLAKLGSLSVQITQSTELDVRAYRVYMGTTPAFVKNETSLVYEGADNFVDLISEANTTKYLAVSVIDSFGPTGALISTELSQAALNVDADVFTYTGLTFKPNTPSTNKVSWTAGTANRNGVDTWNISANSTGVTWTTGILYIYYIAGQTTLQTGTSLLNAISAGGRVLATYKGGTDLIADQGRAFISGDTVLAGTVGAAQLITNTAVITNTAQLADAVITNAKIANATIDYGKITDTLQSSNYNLTAHTGWRLNKTGGITAHDITIYDSAGNIVLASGSKMDFAALMGSTKPQNNATVGADSSNLYAGVGTNLLPNSGWAVGFGHWTVATGTYLNQPSWFVKGPYNTAAFQDGAPDGVSKYIYNNSSTSLVPVIAGQRYEFSVYTGAHRCEVAAYMQFYNAAGSNIGISTIYYNNAEMSGGTALSGYKRLAGFVTAPANATGAVLVIRKGPTFAGQTSSFLFALMPFLGKALTNQTEFSPWSEGSGGMIEQITGSNVSTYIANAAIKNAQIGTAEIGTLSIAGGAVSLLEFASGGTVAAGLPAAADGASAETGNLLTLAASPIDLAANKILTVSGHMRNFDTSPGAFLVRIYRNGVLWSWFRSTPTIFMVNGVSYFPISKTMTEQAAAGVSHTYTVRIVLENGTGTAQRWSTSPEVWLSLELVTGRR